MKSRFNPMTSASNDMNKIEEAAFEKEKRKLAMLKWCKAMREEIKVLKFAAGSLGRQLDVLVAKMSEDDDGL